MTKQEARDIATILIAKTGICFDGTAFDDCKPELSESDINKVVRALEDICFSNLRRMEKKLNISLTHANSTAEIVDIVLYE